MQHRNYVHDCERNYQKALNEGIVDTGTRNLYEQFQQIKRKLEESSRERSLGDRHFRTGLQQGWFEADTAKRNCNRYETELHILANRINAAILKLKKK